MKYSLSIVQMCVWRPLLFLFLLVLHHPSRSLAPASLADLEQVGSEVIVDSSPCSATCGVGLKTQKLCVRHDGGRMGLDGGEEGVSDGGEDQEVRVMFGIHLYYSHVMLCLLCALMSFLCDICVETKRVYRGLASWFK